MVESLGLKIKSGVVPKFKYKSEDIEMKYEKSLETSPILINSFYKKLNSLSISPQIQFITVWKCPGC